MSEPNSRIWMIWACGLSFMYAIVVAALPAQTSSTAPLARATTAPPSVTFTTLHSFDFADGYEPTAGLVQATNGKLYGTTSQGGTNEQGSLFSITTTGMLTLLHSFDITDGLMPYAGMTQGTNGMLYGTTYSGGASGGNGTIFALTPGGALSSVYVFCLHAGCPYGSSPYGGLIQGTNGKLYGTTQSGGANQEGTVFEVTPAGSLTTLHRFTGGDGAGPLAGLLQATDGNFYGTTQYGGTNGDGTAFSINSSGNLTLLYSFCSQSNCTDGEQPVASVMQTADGRIYGTTYYGGGNAACAGGCGTIFTISPAGQLATLHSFDEADGAGPAGSLIQATDEKVYGVTSGGGTIGAGTVFSITPAGILSTLHSFCAQPCSDGANPFGGLVQDTDGSFYGTAAAGGAYGAGTAFSLSVGLGPFVATNPVSGKPGAAVKILGANLIGATSVTFNGTAAVFTVVSHSLIVTTVPTGATTGTVQVVTPKGTLSSNVPFRVR